MNPESEAFWNPMVPELNVLDFTESLEFYTHLLGFEIRFRRTDPDFAYLELGRVQLMIEQAHEKAWITAPLERPFGRGLNLQIEVATIAPIMDRLAAASIPLFRPISESWRQTEEGIEDGQLELLVQDPDGYLLRLVEILGTRNKLSQ